MIFDLLLNCVVFLITFYFCLLAVIGFGEIFQKIVFGKINNFVLKLELSGFYGLFLLTLVSLITSIFVAHNYLHNILLLSIGFVYFFFSDTIKNKKYILYILIISLVLLSALLISKTHDDFSYYHLPFSKYLTEHKVIFGMGNINLGYNFVSSLFFLNSIFFLPFIKYFSFHFSIIFFLIFFNYFLIIKIFTSNKEKIIQLLLIITFLFFNLSFNRIAEYGTDKTGQLLITLLVIQLFSLISFENRKDKIDQILYLIPLIALCISLKTYFVSYLLLGFLIFLIDKKIISNVVKLIFSKSFFCFFLILSFTYFHHFISTGCIISPLPFTCFGESFDWSVKLDGVIELSKWVELWAKGGAGPTFRIDDPNLYVHNLNWVNNWFNVYFKIKFFDQILILTLCFLVTFFTFQKFEFDSSKVKNIQIKKNLIFYIILCIIFSIWFLKHPTLRYGGYSIFFLICTIPFIFFIDFFKKRKNFEKKFLILIVLVSIVFNLKNISRINKELKRDDHYKFANFPFFAIKEKKYETYSNQILPLYSAHHCWATPSPCGQVSQKINVYKKANYFFIKRAD